MLPLLFGHMGAPVWDCRTHFFCCSHLWKSVVPVSAVSSLFAPLRLCCSLGGRSPPVPQGHLEPLQRINISLNVEASWKYPENPRKTSRPKNGGYNPPKTSQHRNRKIHENDFGHMGDFVQAPRFPENIPPTAAPRQMPLSGTLDLGHPTLLQNASKKHLKSSKHMRDMKHMGRYQTTLGVERSEVWNLIA